MSIKLIKFTESDIENLISWVDMPGASDFWASRTYPFPLSREVVLKHLQKTNHAPNELKMFRVVQDQDPKTVGHVELDKFDHQTQAARITRLFIDPKYRNLGIARQATKLLLHYCFKELNLNRVEILAVENNLAALKLYEKIGFKKEGFLRENMVLSGVKQGSHLLSMLSAEYFASVD